MEVKPALYLIGCMLVRTTSVGHFVHKKGLMLVNCSLHPEVHGKLSSGVDILVLWVCAVWKVHMDNLQSQHTVSSRHDKSCSTSSSAE